MTQLAERTRTRKQQVDDENDCEEASPRDREQLLIGRQRFERQVRIFDRPQRVPRIQARADKILARGFDESFHLACLHVAGVILDGDVLITDDTITAVDGPSAVAAA